MSFFFGGGVGSTVESSEITDGTIVNADINASAAIVNSKLAAPHDSTTYTDGGVLLGSGTGSITAMAVLADGEMIVGDGTTDPVAESGATLRTSIGVGTGDAVTFDTLNLQGDANQIVLDSDAGAGASTTITDSASAARTITLPDATDTLVGKATTDTFTNKTFDANGTGNSLSNIDVADFAAGTDGELITWDAAGSPTTIAAGTDGYVLRSSGVGAEPVWQANRKLVQRIVASTSTAGSTTTVIPTDDTIPQNTEGAEVLTASITPTNSSNRLQITLYVTLDANAADASCMALFQDTTADALASAPAFFQASSQYKAFAFTHEMAAGTTSSTTFKLRVGPQVGTTTVYWNQYSGANTVWSTTDKCYIVIDEFEA